MKKAILRTLGVILSLSMVISSLAVSSFAVETDEQDTINVTFSCSDSQIIMPKQTISVYDGISEEYGYTTAASDHNSMTIDTVTFFDVLVAAHKLYYGDAFTSETSKDYLVMNSSFITKAFGKSAASSGFTVNGVMANDGIINESYGSYTGYSCDTAQLENDDDITFYFYQDNSYWSDFYAHFDKDEYTAKIGEDIAFNVSGYCVMYYGINDAETIKNDYTLPITNGTIFTYDNGVSTQIGTTDSNGNANVSFSEAGTYQIYVTGSTIDSYEEDCPIIIAWSSVTVSEEEKPDDNNNENKSFWEKVYSVLKWIIRIPKKVLNFLFAGC